MKGLYSYKWLSSYFDEKLPTAEKIRDGLNEFAFEVESIEKKGEDTLIELDIYPNRSSDCLTHYGIAKEISTIFNIPLNKKFFVDGDVNFSDTDLFSIDIDTDGCDRYTISLIEFDEVFETPSWMRERLESVNQRCINSIVDVTNYVLLELGQPLHAFDADKMSNSISVKDASDKEEMITLTGEKVVLNNKDLVIFDKGKSEILGLAGIKGGISAEVDENTRRIYLEAATFDSERIRNSSRRVGIETDASLRFSQIYPAELIDYTLKRALSLYRKIGGKTIASKDSKTVGLKNKIYTGVSTKEVNKLLGTSFSDDDVGSILGRLGFNYRLINSREEFVKQARENIGKEYKYGASVSYEAPERFDCSSFVSYCASRSGKSLPRVSINQYLYSEKVDSPVDGDLVFFVSENAVAVSRDEELFEGIFPVVPGKVEGGINHCGIYVGEERVIHAKGGKGVVEEDIKDEEGNFIGYGRIFEQGERRFVVEVPVERSDLIIKEDLIEEITRIHGFDNIEAKTQKEDTTDYVNKKTAYKWKISKLLKGLLFSQVMTYSFKEKGDVGVLYPAAKDKSFLRVSLESGIRDSVKQGAYNGELLGISKVLVFEIGNVFKKDGEYTNFCIGIGEVLGGNKFSVEKTFDEVKKVLSDNSIVLKGDIVDGVYETDFDELIKNLPEISYDWLDDIGHIEYKPLSKYPFVLRDIAVFVNKGDREKLEKIIKEKAGDLLVRINLFDEYEKENKVSYAYHLVFQSGERTLNDEEVAGIMEKITGSLNKDWEVR